MIHGTLTKHFKHSRSAVQWNSAGGGGGGGGRGRWLRDIRLFLDDTGYSYTPLIGLRSIPVNPKMGLCFQKNLLQKVEVLKGKLDLQYFKNKCLDCLTNRPR